MDKIGVFRGKNISTMTHDELLDFAAWAGKEIERLSKYTNLLGGEFKN